MWCYRFAMRFFWLFFISTVSLAATKESLGTLSVSDVLLRPNFTTGSSKLEERGFNLGESSLAVTWSLNDKFSGTIRLGPRSLIAPPAHYTATVNSDITMVEAYAQFDHPYGRFRFGEIPLDFGLEGAKSEGDLIFPRAFLFSERIVGLRDVGVSYAIDYNNFFTEIAVHNGEGDENQDNRLWYTSHWGYKFERAQVGLAGQTGQTTPASTQNSQDTLASVDPTRAAKWRMLGVFGNWNPKKFVMEMEAYVGERVQDTGTHDFATGHFDLGYEFTKELSLFARYDMLEPDTRVSDDEIHRAAVAFVVNNQSRNSRLIFMAAHDFHEGSSQGEDQLRFIWSLSPTQLPSLF
jgi:hypothetical protein